jgi:DNA polymerase-3 subunit delta'
VVIKLSESLKAKVVVFSIQKIDDARNLIAFLNFSIPEKTLIVIKNFQHASEECSNALLKSIEEPQENIIFAIHSTNENTISPTIRSRCKLISSVSEIYESEYKDVEDFLKMDPVERFSVFDDKKKREDALEFANKIISYIDREITSGGINVKILTDIAKRTIEYKKSLEANGNVNLQTLSYLSDINN